MTQPARQLPALPTNEVGYVNPQDPTLAHAPESWKWELLEQVPDLVYPFSLRVYSRMPREDARVWSMLSAIKLPIRRTAYRIDPNGARPEVAKLVADDLGLPLVGQTEPSKRPRQRGRFSWSEHLNEALSCLRYGHSVFEQVYEPREDGLLHLEKLAPRPQHTISKWHVARDGGLISIEQDPPSGVAVIHLIDGRPITVDRLVVYRNEPEPGNWIGTSLLRPSYKHWMLKDELMRIEATAARRNGVGMPVITVSEDESMDPARMALYKQMAKSWQVGNNGGAALPYGTDVQLKGVTGSLPQQFIRSAIEYHDKQIALAGLAHFLNLDRGGSYALASVQADTFVQSVQAIAESIVDIANRHVVEDLVDWNFGPDEPAPLIVADEIGSRQDATAAALQMLVSAGLLQPDEGLKAFIRQQLGAPPANPDEEPEPEPEPEQPQQPQPLAPAPPVAAKTGQGQLW